MSKTSRKSLPAVILMLCLCIAQAALFSHSSNTGVAHAATGPQIYLNATSSTQGAQQIVAVRGTGFSINSQVLITFNAPYSSDGSPLSPRVIPPSVNRAGDNRVLVPPTVANSFPNVIEVLANTDSLGNIITSNGSNGTVSFGIPTTAVDGIYEIDATDLPTGAYTATQYTVNRGGNQSLIATPLSGSSVQLGGIINITARPNSFNNGDEIRFFLEDFAASASFGFPIVPSFNSFDPLVPPAQPQVELLINSCGTIPIKSGPSGTPISFCSASINGDVAASVELSPANSANPCILSTYYYDQVFAIVAKNLGDAGLPANTYGLPSSGNQYAAGVHIDHGQTHISLSTNQQNLGGTVTISGTGFGAYATVTLYFANIANTFGTCSVTGLTTASTSFSVPGCLLGTVTTDANGAFTVTFSIPPLAFQGGPIQGQNGNLGLSGYILAEDFSTAPFCAGARLNEAVTAGFTVNPTAGSGNLTLSTAAGGTSTTAAISSTVYVTGTGYIANEAVDVLLTGPNSIFLGVSRLGSALAPGAPLLLPGSTGCSSEIDIVLHANAQGVATGSFLVPETCNTVTVNSGSGRINNGASVAVDGIGEQSGLDNSATLTIPKTQAMISPVNGIRQVGGESGDVGSDIAVTLSGNGFAANEPVTFQFGLIDPFTGHITNAYLTASAVSDGLGNVSLAATISAPGGLYTLQAKGLNSSFSANISNSLPFVALPNNGNLNCPQNPVLAGQPFVISGSNFASSTTTLVTINFPTFTSVFVPTDANGTFSVTITTPLGTPANAYQVVVSGLVNNAQGGNFQEQLRTCTVSVGSTVPAVQAVPNSGPIGITVTVTGQGFGNAEPIAVSLQYVNTAALSGTDVPGTSQVVGTSDANGNFSGVFTVKSSVNALIPGAYNLAATGTQTKLVARTSFIVTGGTSSGPLTTLYFAEGYTGTVAAGANADFTESLSVLNANNFTTTYTVTYFIEGAAASKSFSGTIGANTVIERSVNTDVGANASVAAEVISPAPIAAERVIARSNGGKALDSSSSLGQLVNTGATVPDGGVNYYFASGEVQLTNEEYLTLLNPTSTTANVTINILPQGTVTNTAAPAVPAITATVPGNARVTVRIRAKLTSAGITKFGMSVNSNVPLATERVEYYGDGIGSGKYGATTQPAGTQAFRQYIFASDTAQYPTAGGNTKVGTGNDVSSVDIINPGTSAAGSATVTVSFFDRNGVAINSQQVQVDGGTRETVKVNDVVGTQPDVFSAVVVADKNVYVEKPTFYGGDPNAGGTFAVETVTGSPAGLTSVAFPYLDLTSSAGSAISQTVFLYNPGAADIQVRGTYVTNSQTVTKTYTVHKNSIATISVNTDAASLPKGALGGVFQIVQTGSGTSDSFVAQVLTNSPDFKMVLGNQGTYPIGAITGP